MGFTVCRNRLPSRPVSSALYSRSAYSSCRATWLSTSTPRELVQSCHRTNPPGFLGRSTGFCVSLRKRIQYISVILQPIAIVIVLTPAQGNAFEDQTRKLGNTFNIRHLFANNVRAPSASEDLEGTDHPILYRYSQQSRSTSKSVHSCRFSMPLTNECP